MPEEEGRGGGAMSLSDERIAELREIQEDEENTVVKAGIGELLNEIGELRKENSKIRLRRDRSHMWAEIQTLQAENAKLREGRDVDDYIIEVHKERAELREEVERLRKYVDYSTDTAWHPHEKQPDTPLCAKCGEADDWHLDWQNAVLRARVDALQLVYDAVTENAIAWKREDGGENKLAVAIANYRRTEQ